jgi:hypothetical protein
VHVLGYRRPARREKTLLIDLAVVAKSLDTTSLAMATGSFVSAW